MIARSGTKNSKWKAVTLWVLLLVLLNITFPITAQDMPRTVNLKNNTANTLFSDKNSNAFPKLDINLNAEKKEVKLIDISGEKDNESDLMKEPELANHGEVLAKKLNKKDKEIKEEYKSDQYLGDFKSNGKFVTIFCRDHEYADGDRVKVYVNDTVARPDILLDYNFQRIIVPLKKGFNKVDFQALNQGSSGPNTAEFRVYDDQGRLVSSNQWNLTTGVKATLIVVKE